MTSGLPSGRYMQWRATLTTSNNFYTPVLHSVTAAASLGPLVTTDAATFVDSNGAVLNGTLNSLGQSSGTVYVGFQLGNNPEPLMSYQTRRQPITAPGTYSFGLIRFIPGTTYYYRARAFDLEFNPPVYGDVVSFTTTPVSPSVTTNPAGSVTASSAVLNGYLASVGAASCGQHVLPVGHHAGWPLSQLHSSRSAWIQRAVPGQPVEPGDRYHLLLPGQGGRRRQRHQLRRRDELHHAEGIAPTWQPATPPSVTSNSATLNGSLANMGAASTVNVSYQWGTTSGGPYPNSTPAQAMTARRAFQRRADRAVRQDHLLLQGKGRRGRERHRLRVGEQLHHSGRAADRNTTGATGITGLFRPSERRPVCPGHRRDCGRDILLRAAAG